MMCRGVEHLVIHIRGGTEYSPGAEEAGRGSVKRLVKASCGWLGSAAPSGNRGVLSPTTSVYWLLLRNKGMLTYQTTRNMDEPHAFRTPDGGTLSVGCGPRFNEGRFACSYLVCIRR